MRKLVILCLVAALFFGVVRLCTGVVYGGVDAPMTYLVLKAPSWNFQRTEAAGDPVQRRFVLDDEEPSLVYERAYFALMRQAPLIAGMLALMAVTGAMRMRRQPRMPRTA